MLLVRAQSLGMKNRRWNRFRAWIGGYFWLPCPLCGREFGGHEVRQGETLWLSPLEGRCVCPDCGPEARRRSESLRHQRPVFSKES